MVLAFFDYFNSLYSQNKIIYIEDVDIQPKTLLFLPTIFEIPQPN
jgi:hypothetical protein